MLDESSGSVYVAADAADVAVFLDNLIENAIVYTPPVDRAAPATRSAVVTHERRDVVEAKRHHHAEPGDARGPANEADGDARGRDGEAEHGDDPNRDRGDERSGHHGDHSGRGHDGSGDDHRDRQGQRRFPAVTGKARPSRASAPAPA
jgi:hypothetical protein